MRAVVQRVRSARVRIGERTAAEIGRGLLVLLGVAADDRRADAAWLADKIGGLRIFESAPGRMDCSLRDIGGDLLVVSQFTLLADTRKGRRPSFTQAAAPDLAEPLYEHFVELCRATGLAVATGEFGASMDVELTNQGPVTILIDSPPHGEHDPTDSGAPSAAA